jgi:hypothetical protein
LADEYCSELPIDGVDSISQDQRVQLLEDLQVTALPHAQLLPSSSASPLGLASEPPPADAQMQQADEHMVPDDSLYDAVRCMDYWDSVPWTALDHYTPTIVEVPPQCQHAVCQLKEALMDDILAAKGQHDEIGQARGWKALTFLDRLLFAAPPRSRLGQPQTLSLTKTLVTRVRAAWEGRWHQLWSAAVASGHGTSPPPPTKTDRQEAMTIEKLVAAGEVRKASGKLLKEEPLATGPGVVTELRNLFPRSANQNVVPHGVRARPLPATRTAVKDAIAYVLSHPSRRSSADRAGSRFEHWQIMEASEDGISKASSVLELLLLGDVPEEVLAAHAGGRVVALRKKTGGLRPLVIGSTLRRIGMKALDRVFKEHVRDAVAPFQYGVAKPGGAEALHKVVSAHAQCCQDAVVLTVDFQNAFNRLSRSHAAQELSKTLPEMSAYHSAWTSRPSTHSFIDGQGEVHHVTASIGVEQGCPASPLVFAVAVHPFLVGLAAAVRSSDRHGKVVAYLDDVTVLTNPAGYTAATQYLATAGTQIGLDTNLGKCSVWCSKGPTAVPGSIVPYTTEPVVLQAHVHLESSSSIADETRLCSERAAFGTHLVKLHKAGLRVQSALALWRNRVGTDASYLQRVHLLTPEACNKLDTTAAEVTCALMRTPTDATLSEQMLLPSRLGGMGLASVRRSAPIGFLASWANHCEEVAEKVKLPTVDALLETAPSLQSAVSSAVQRCRASGCNLPERAGRALQQNLGAKGLAGRLSREAAEATRTRLMDTVEGDHRAILRSGGGPGTGSWALPETSPSTKMSDTAMRLAFRLRHYLPIFAPGQCCGHRHPNGQLCGATLDVHGRHAMVCRTGGGMQQRHDNLRDEVADVQRARSGRPALTEQYVARWSTPSRAARLDVVTTDALGRDEFIDVAVVHPLSAETQKSAVSKDGAAAAREEQDKHRRYPGPFLTPAVFEAVGRPGESAQQWLRALHCACAPHERTTLSQEAWQRLSCVIQRGNAAMLASAGQLV